MKLRLLFYLVSLFICMNVHGQKAAARDSVMEQIFLYGPAGQQGIFYETVAFKNNFLNQLNNVEKFQYQKPLHTIGYSVKARYALTSKIAYTPGFEIGLFIPQKLSFSDTIRSVIQGYDFNLQFISFDFFEYQKVFHLQLGTSLRIGRLRLKNEEIKDLQNNFIGPSLSIEPSFWIKKFIRIGLKADYFFDLTKGNWNRLLFSTKHDPYPVADFKQDALRLQLSVAIMLYPPKMNY